MQRLTMSIGGMSCGGCVTSVRAALRAIPGVRVDDLSVGSATVTYDESRTSAAAIARTIQDAGYEPFVATRSARKSGCCGGSGQACGGAGFAA